MKKRVKRKYEKFYYAIEEQLLFRTFFTYCSAYCYPSANANHASLMQPFSSNCRNIMPQSALYYFCLIAISNLRIDFRDHKSALRHNRPYSTQLADSMSVTLILYQILLFTDSINQENTQYRMFYRTLRSFKLLFWLSAFAGSVYPAK